MAYLLRAVRPPLVDRALMLPKTRGVRTLPSLDRSVMVPSGA